MLGRPGVRLLSPGSCWLPAGLGCVVHTGDPRGRGRSLDTKQKVRTCAEGRTLL